MHAARGYEPGQSLPCIQDPSSVTLGCQIREAAAQSRATADGLGSLICGRSLAEVWTATGSSALLRVGRGVRVRASWSAFGVISSFFLIKGGNSGPLYTESVPVRSCSCELRRAEHSKLAASVNPAGAGEFGLYPEFGPVFFVLQATSQATLVLTAKFRVREHGSRRSVSFRKDNPMAYASVQRRFKIFASVCRR